MNNAQKVIKYVAIAVAIFLTVTIISSILTGVLAIFGISSIIEIANNNVETMDYTKEYVNIYSIEMDVAAVELEIEKTDANTLKIEGTAIPVDYKFEEDEGVLKIKNKKVSKDSKLVIYVPNNLSKLDIDIGAGKIQMENLQVQELSLDTGAAVANITNIIATSSTKIDAGVGDISIKNSDISNLDLDAGIGNVEYNGYLRDTNTLNCGVGNIDIALEGTDTLYKIIAEKSVGEIKVNGTKLSGNQTIGEGSNTLKISGGIGSINVTY